MRSAIDAATIGGGNDAFDWLFKTGTGSLLRAVSVVWVKTRRWCEMDDEEKMKSIADEHNNKENKKWTAEASTLYSVVEGRYDTDYERHKEKMRAAMVCAEIAKAEACAGAVMLHSVVKTLRAEANK